MYRKLLLGFVATASLASSSAFGAVVITSSNYITSGASGNYTNASATVVSNTDLINGLLPTATNYVGCCETTNGTTAPLTDGSTGNGLNDPTTTANAAFANTQFFATYTLPTGNGNGYDLSSISVATGHQDDRVNQGYRIELSTDGTTFTSIGDFSYHPSTGNGGSAISTASDNTSIPLGTGIKAVRFTILDNGYGVYRELDVQGTQSVPEPTSMALMGVASGALLARRRRA